MRAVFECVAQAIKNKGVRGLCELVPGGPYLIDICGEAFKLWRERRRDAQLRDELAKVAAASAEEARKTAEEVARQVVGEGKPEDVATVELYLAQIPGAVRASLKRSDDPTGRTVPPELALDTPEDLARLLPQRAPQFRADMDLPGRSGWKLEQMLGAGGFGEVWLVRHTFIPQARAVKFCTDPQLRTRLTSHEGKGDRPGDGPPESPERGLAARCDSRGGDAVAHVRVRGRRRPHRTHPRMAEARAG